MTELEYKLMSTIGYATDMVADFSDEMDEFACEVGDALDDSGGHELASRAHVLADDILRINTLLGDAFSKVKEGNKEEWYNLLKAECKIIERSINGARKNSR